MEAWEARQHLCHEPDYCQVCSLALHTLQGMSGAANWDPWAGFTGYGDGAYTGGVVPEQPPSPSVAASYWEKVEGPAGVPAICFDELPCGCGRIHWNKTG